MKTFNTLIAEVKENAHEKLQEVLDCVNEALPEGKGFTAEITTGKLNKEGSEEPYECVVIRDNKDVYIGSIIYFTIDNVDVIEIRSHGGDSRHRYKSREELKSLLPKSLYFIGVR